MRSHAFCRGRTIALTLCATALGATVPTSAAAQAPPPRAETTESGLPAPLEISPGGAFLRALAVPGWGHAAIGAHARGGFYFAAQAATVYTLIRSRQRLLDARERLAFREDFVRQEALGAGITDPAEIDALLDGDAGVAELRRLEDSRGDQQEDMVALGIFLVFLSGADAYVSAHLSRFPEPIEVEAAPVGGGRYDLGLKIRIR